MVDKKWMRVAIEEAMLAKDAGEWPFGAAVISGNKMVSKDRRRESELKTVLAHAEMRAIDGACRKLRDVDLSSCTIYCTNEPCLMCASAIFQAKIKRVVVGVSRDDLAHLLRKRKFRIEDLALDTGYEVEIVRGVLKDQILNLFSDIQS